MAEPAAYRRYNWLTIGLAYLCVVGFGLYGRQFEPLTGDLTRIGWFSENEFGWAGEQQRFVPPLAPAATLDGSYDIVAIGDSFTAEEYNPGITWPHFLARDTGLAIGVFDSGIDSLDSVLASPGFRDHPPAVLIYEVVERSLIPAHRGGDPADCVAHQPTPQPGLSLAPRPIAPERTRRTLTRPWDDWPASYAMNYLLQNALRWWRGHEATSAVRLEMMRDGLFTSRHSRGLLVYAEDFNKENWSSAEWRASLCDLAHIQDRVEANGHTAFLAMIVPDKLTVYAPFLADRRVATLSHLRRLDEIPSVNLVRIDRALDPAARADLYMPNDTHWSAATHEMAARLIGDRLREIGALAAAAVKAQD
jgi:hypothetical protein